MHGVEAIRSHLTGEDEALLRRVLCAEADALVDDHEIAAGLEGSTLSCEVHGLGAGLYRVGE